MPNATITQLNEKLARLEAALERAEKSLAQETAISKSACTLADRYRAERDGARAATEATKSKALDGALFGNDVQSAIREALGATAIQKNAPAPEPILATNLDRTSTVMKHALDTRTAPKSKDAIFLETAAAKAAKR